MFKFSFMSHSVIAVLGGLFGLIGIVQSSYATTPAPIYSLQFSLRADAEGPCKEAYRIRVNLRSGEYLTGPCNLPDIGIKMGKLSNDDFGMLKEAAAFLLSDLGASPFVHPKFECEVVPPKNPVNEFYRIEGAYGTNEWFALLMESHFSNRCWRASPLESYLPLADYLKYLVLKYTEPQ